MPATQLDAVSALIVIDLQKGIASLPTVTPASEIIERAVALADAFRERALPVVLVNVTGLPPGRTDAGPRKLTFGHDWTELMPELRQKPGDNLVSKQRVCAFLGTSMDRYLRERRVTQVVIAGITTSAGADSTARNAYDLGYNVTLAVDAMTDRSADAHRHSTEKVFPRIAETGTTDAVLKLLRER